jgi:hypothetical protein
VEPNVSGCIPLHDALFAMNTDILQRTVQNWSILLLLVEEVEGIMMTNAVKKT